MVLVSAKIFRRHILQGDMSRVTCRYGDMQGDAKTAVARLL